MSRPSIMLIVAGSAALLIALVLLYQSTRSDAVPLPPSAAVNDRTEAPTPPATAPVAAAPERPAAPAKPSAPVVAAPSPPRLENILPSAATEPAPVPGASNEGIHFGAPQLQTQTKAVEPLVRECVEKAALTGDRSSGTAIVTYVVAKRGDKFVVEDPGTEPDKTTVQNDGLLECLAGTAKAMKFEGLPRSANEIYVTRKITLEGGKLTEYKHVAFSYLR